MSTDIKFLTQAELEAGIEEILQSPKVEGRLELIVRRPRAGQREAITEGILDLEAGLVGDNWLSRTKSSQGVSSKHKDMLLQLPSSFCFYNRSGPTTNMIQAQSQHSLPFYEGSALHFLDPFLL